MTLNGKSRFKTVGKDLDPHPYRACRQMLVGPWCNQPDEYEGYNGAIGWPGATRLRSGRWLVTFSSGYWHGSPPWTDEIRKDDESREKFEYYRSLGCPDIRAPRGGRSHVIHSDDEGRTWSAPETLVDTDMDDRHPTILELDDGTLLCTFMTQRLPQHSYVQYTRSTDGGNTWSQPVQIDESILGIGNGSAIQIADGTVIFAAEGPLDTSIEGNSICVFRSADRGATFERAAVISADHELHEPTVTQLPGGRLVMVTRLWHEVSYSDDNGKSWTAPEPLNVKLSDPHLLTMPNGVLACFHGAWNKGGVCVTLSPDGGRTWHGPDERFGYFVDPSVYGYSHPMLLPDGTVFIVYNHSGIVSAADARTGAIWGLKVRINDNADGVEILPAAGSPAAAGAFTSDLAQPDVPAEDLRRGEL
jgi:photosystem II stability/assembly factor-like uncharacterized protein